MAEGAEALPLNSSSDLDKYKCGLCLKFLKNPYVTKCLHRYCRICIVNALNLNRECPHPECTQQLPQSVHSNAALISPDNILKNKMDQLQGLNCTYHDKGCTLKFSLYDLEIHEENCVFRDDGIYKCMFHYNGCDEQFANKPEYEAHLANSLETHLIKILDTMENLKIELHKEKETNKKLMLSLEDRLTERVNFNRNDTNKLINRVFEACQNKITSIKNDLECVQDDFAEKMMIHNSGSFIWTIYDFEYKLQNTREFLSEDFHVTPCGYKFAIRLYVNSKRNVGVFLQIQNGENDEDLSWPFYAKISISVIHPTFNNAKNCTFGPDWVYFENPYENEERQCLGWPNRVAVHYLRQNGFLLNDTLIIKAKVQKATLK